jgi:hypothetical protein
MTRLCSMILLTAISLLPPAISASAQVQIEAQADIQLARNAQHDVFPKSVLHSNVQKR